MPDDCKVSGRLRCRRSRPCSSHPGSTVMTDVKSAPHRSDLQARRRRQLVGRRRPRSTSRERCTGRRVAPPNSMHRPFSQHVVRPNGCTNSKSSSSDAKAPHRRLSDIRRADRRCRAQDGVDRTDDRVEIGAEPQRPEAIGQQREIRGPVDGPWWRWRRWVPRATTGDGRAGRPQPSCAEPATVVPVEPATVVPVEPATVVLVEPATVVFGRADPVERWSRPSVIGR